jgi:hypothetical protein
LVLVPFSILIIDAKEGG